MKAAFIYADGGSRVDQSKRPKLRERLRMLHTALAGDVYQNEGNVSCSCHLKLALQFVIALPNLTAKGVFDRYLGFRGILSVVV
jgi:hypothetical protein